MPENLKPDVFQLQLAALAPRGARLDRDRLMFLAGRASVKRVWFWPAALLATTAAALLVSALHEPAPQVVERIVERRVEVVLPAVREPAVARAVQRVPATAWIGSTRPDNYSQLVQTLLEQGIEALPERVETAQASEDRPSSYGQLREELLGG